MIKVSRLTDYAVLVLKDMAEGLEGLATATALAEKTGVPGPTVAKVLKVLAKAGVLKAMRGMSGGYVLARAPEAISIAEIIEAIDGPIAITDCIESTESGCVVEHVCPMRSNWQRVNHAIRQALQGVTLADMSCGKADIAFMPKDAAGKEAPL